MSGNSRSNCFTTAPIVSDFWRTAGSPSPSTPAGGRGRPCSTSTLIYSPEEGQLVLAHLKLVTVLELVGFDPLPIYIGPVQGPEVVDVDAVAAPYKQRVVAGHGHVVEEDLGLGAAPDPRLVATDEKRLPCPATAGPDDERGVIAPDRLRIDSLEIAGLPDLP